MERPRTVTTENPQWMTGNKFQSPEEIRRRKNLKKGIEFTLLVCGQEGTGKVSFINTLCKQAVLEKDTSRVSMKPENAHVNPGIEVVKMHVNIVDEDSTPIALDVVMFPGFGDNIDNSRCTARVVDYLERQFDDMLKEECSYRRDPHFKDGRPHAALYFVKPTTRGLRELDVATMRELATRVNVIPVLAKSDTLTEEELHVNKNLVLNDIKANRIPIYNFCTETDDPEIVEEARWLVKHLPFAVAGSYETEVVDGELRHFRAYPWGTVRVEDPQHTDFTMLRNAIFGSHLQELKESTHMSLYENYRRQKLAESLSGAESPFATKVTSPTLSSDATMSRKQHSRSLSNHSNGTHADTIQENPGLIEIFSEIEGGDVVELTLQEIELKKKRIEAYMANLQMMESRIRGSA